MNDVLGTMFPNHLTLHKNKRCADEADAIRMHMLCDDLRGGMPINNVIQKYNFSVISFKDMPEEAATAAHVSYSNGTARRVNDWAHPIATGRPNNDYRVGDVLLGGSVSSTNDKKGFKNKFPGEGRSTVFLNSNCLYTIKNMSDSKKIVIETGDNRVLFATMEDLPRSFNRTHACTCHSSQGLTLGSTVYIHDYGMPMHPSTPADRWNFTAILYFFSYYIKHHHATKVKTQD